MKRLIAYHSTLVMGNQREKKPYPTESVQHTQHPIGSSPPYIAMKGDTEGVDNSKFELKGFECLNAPTRRLDL